MKRLWKWFKRSIQSFLLWFPVLFADRWFDSAYLLAIIERKCRHDAKMYRTKGIGINSDSIAGDLEEVADICHKLQDIDLYYYDQFHTPHYEKWAEAYRASLYPRAEASKQQELKEWHAATDKGSAALQVDLDRLAELIKEVYTWSD